MRPDDCPHPNLACIECHGYEYCYLTDENEDWSDWSIEDAWQAQEIAARKSQQLGINHNPKTEMEK